MNIEIYSDGSGMSADTDGGYGWVMVVNGVKHSEGSGHVPNSTNNDMELEAAIQGLMAVHKFWMESADPYVPSVILISDSQIVLGWADGTYRFKQESKLDKYKILKSLVNNLNCKTKWVKGHSGDEHNTRCDKLANLARKGVTETTVDKPLIKSDTKIGVKKTDTASVWYKDRLMVLDFELGIIEAYNRDVHGKRGSIIEIRDGKDR